MQLQLVALLLLSPLCFAAPIPKAPSIPGIEVTVAGDTSVMNVTVRNDTREALELPYEASPWEAFTVVLQGDNGKTYTFKSDPKGDRDAIPGTFKIPAGKSEALELHVCHVMPLLGDAKKVTATVQLKVGNKIAEAKPFVLNP